MYVRQLRVCADRYLVPVYVAVFRIALEPAAVYPVVCGLRVHCYQYDVRGILPAYAFVYGVEGCLIHELLRFIHDEHV